MKNKKSLTLEQLQIIKSCVEKYGSSAGCAVAAKKLKKSFNAICHQYYSKIYATTISSKTGHRQGVRIKLNEKDTARYLAKEIKNNPDNISGALLSTATYYNVSISYLAKRYYGCSPTIDKATDPLYRFNLPLSVCTVGGSKTLYNGKRSTNQTVEMKSTNWILMLLNKLFKHGKN